MKLTFFFLFFILMISLVSGVCDYAIYSIDSTTDTIIDMDIGDLDGDGYNDIVVCDLDEPAVTSQIIIYTNDGGGGFTEETIYSVDSCGGVFIVDLNQDGYNDILSSNSGNNEIVYHRNNITSWNNSRIHLIGAGTGIVSADFDKDGDIDIAVGSGSEVRVMMNDGDENFGMLNYTMTAPTYLDLAYINNDDYLDLVIGSFSSNDIYWLQNLGSSFTNFKYISTYGGLTYGVGDYDNDGDFDIFMGKEISQIPTILRNTGVGTFTNITLDIPVVEGETRAIDLYDLDGNGYQEIIFHDNTLNNIMFVSYDALEFTYVNLTTNVDESHVLKVSDITGDQVPDIVYDNLESTLNYIDGLACDDMPTTDYICTFPEIFCDDFNYLTPLAQKDNYVWNVVDRALNVDYYFAPSGYEMRLNGNDYLSPAHYNPLFRKEYYISYGETVTETDISPVFSTEFDYRPIKGNMTFAIDGKLQRTAVWLEARNTSSAWQSLYYLNGSDKVGTSEGVLNLICSDCIGYSSNTEVKVTAFFHDYRGVHYNDSFGQSSYNVYITVANGTKYSLEDIPFYSNRTLNQKFQFFIKEETDAFYIDNYYVYVGTDRNVDTTPQYFEQFYTPITYNATTGGTAGTGDLADAIESNWCVIGICSLASRVITALVLMLFLGMGIIGFMIQQRLNPNAMAVIIPEILFMILLTFIKLLPIWIPIVVVLFGAGIGALAVVYASKT